MSRPRVASHLTLVTSLTLLLAPCGGDGGGGGGGGGTTEPPALTSIDVTPGGATLTSLGEARQLQAVGRDASGSQVTGLSFTWSSTDESVATVSQGGLVTAEDNGNATVQARADGVTGIASITVDQSPSTVSMTPGSTTLTSIGATEQFTAAVFDELGNPVTDASANVSWSSSDESVATVDGSGLATALASGNTVIAAETEGVSDDGPLMVGQEPATVLVTPESTTLSDLGVTRQLDATALDAGGSEIADATFTWSSSDTTTATVDAAGLVTSVREGTVEIEARVGGVAATASLAVELPPGQVVWVPSGDGLWSDALNWSCKCLPGSGDDVLLTDDGSYTVTVDADALVNRLEVGGPAGAKTVHVPAGKTLDISGSSSTGANGTLELHGGSLDGTGQLTNRGVLSLKEGLLATFVQNEGTLEVSGPGAAGSSMQAAGSWATARSAAPGESVIEGGFATTSTSVIRIVADQDLTAGGAPATLTVSDGFTNAGLIEMITASGSSEGRLAVGGTGELENLGEIVSRSASGGSGINRFLARLQNQGVVRVLDQSFLVDKASAAHRNEGTVTVDGGEMRVRQSGTDPAFTNVGSMEVAAGATLTTDGGAFAHGQGAILQGPGRVRIRQAALDLQDDLIVADGEMEFDGSEVGGTGQLRNEATLVLEDGSRIAAPLQNAGTLRVLNTSPDPLESRIEGTLTTEAGSIIQVGDEADVAGEDLVPTVLVVADGFANNGLVELITESNSSEAKLRVEGTGLLENAGEIVNRGAGGGIADNLLEAALRNSGDVRIAASKLRLDKLDAEHTNEAGGRVRVEQGEMRLKLTGASPLFTNKGTATLDIASGASLVTDEGSLINEAGGLIQGDGTLGVENAGVSLAEALVVTGTIRMSDGTLNGPSLVTVQGTLELEGFSTVNAPVEVADGGTLALHAPVADPTLQTNVELLAPLTTNPTSTVELLADGTGGTILTLPDDFTNEGTLALLNGAAGSRARLEVLGGTSSLVNNGEIVSAADGGSGTNEIDANLNNNSTVRVPSETLVVSPTSRVDANHVNAAGATIVVGEAGGAAARLDLTGATPESIGNAGTVTVHGGGILGLGASTLNQPGGRIEGDGTIEATLGLASRGTIAPGVGGPGVLTVDGDLTLEEMLIGEDYISTLEIEVGGLSAGSQHDQLEVTGQATLAGSLSVEQIGGFVPAEGDPFTVITYASAVDDFVLVTREVEEESPPGLEWSGAAGAMSYVLTVIRP